ncbi:hypothetical protein DL240_18060 [Lujinxingia litoralis]|uniref:Lipoprotein n=1 Tax=Lujinxingia litoralis TaxID=2211119 RepID=A0A328C6Y8_9DELT|nr:hypothetical protein [Lujinxingia litoralis]RAL20284.1 hypothetical protein DL240_18060 [Lujinxingia litoralis]
MARFVMLALVAALAFPSTGCFHNRIVTSPDYNPSKSTPDAEELRLHILELIPLNSPVNLEATCPNGAGVVESRIFFRVYFLGFSQTRVYCNTVAADAGADSADTLAALKN